MAGRYKSKIGWSEVTPREVFMSRRQWMTGAAALGLGAIAGPSFANIRRNAKFSTLEEPNTFEEITSYNNFYEFGTGKDDPARFADALTTDPWSVEIDGMVERPGNYNLADILGAMDIEERVYRLRCVERWSMVIPWVGFELADMLKMAGADMKAKYVRFETLYRPDEMRGQRRRTVPWPYVEGLRMDEALHPLTFMATGLYGEEVLPNQNGAPIRLVVPWKYGFKSIKSIVKVTVQNDEPLNSWQEIAPNEYGFYANVNPNVDHPRWSQAMERRVGGGLLAKNQPTEMFNGYGEEVASLYEGMDLAKFY